MCVSLSTALISDLMHFSHCELKINITLIPFWLKLLLKLIQPSYDRFLWSMLWAKSQPFIMATYTTVWLEMSKARLKAPCKCILEFRLCQVSMAAEPDKRSGLPMRHLSDVLGLRALSGQQPCLQEEVSVSCRASEHRTRQRKSFPMTLQ